MALRETKQELSKCLQASAVLNTVKEALAEVKTCEEKFSSDNSRLKQTWIDRLAKEGKKVHLLTEREIGIKNRQDFVHDYIKSSFWSMLRKQSDEFMTFQTRVVTNFRDKYGKSHFSEEMQAQANNNLVNIIYDDMNYF